MVSGATARPVHLNGKWLSRAMTGTERYANEVVRELVSRDLVDRPLVLHLPRNALVPQWLPAGTPVVRHRSRGVVFEQVVLPWATRGELLVSLAGPAPLAKMRQLVVMHDATFLVWPQGFSRRFVAWYRLMYVVLARSALHLVTVSMFSRAELARLLDVPAHRYTVAPCGHEHFLSLAATQPVLPREFRPTAPFVVCVGTLAQHKNLLGPARALAEAGWQVLLVGAGGPSRIFSSTQDPLPEGVLALGRISDEELAWCYDNAVALVFPSRYEGFGLPVVEAQSRGCAVVASTAASLPEVLGGSGLQFSPDDQNELLAAVAALTDPTLHAAKTAAGSRNVQRYRWSETAKVIARLLNDSEVRSGLAARIPYRRRGRSAALR